MFFRNEDGQEPVRKWLKLLPKREQIAIGSDIQIVQWRWPIGMPLVKSLGAGLWEVRSTLVKRISRVFFCLCGSKMVLLHGIIKKSQKTSKQDLTLARDRLNLVKKGK